MAPMHDVIWRQELQATAKKELRHWNCHYETLDNLLKLVGHVSCQLMLLIAQNIKQKVEGQHLEIHIYANKKKDTNFITARNHRGCRVPPFPFPL